jgi:hypothetical protein
MGLERKLDKYIGCAQINSIFTNVDFEVSENS